MHLIRQKHNISSCQWEYINNLRQDGIPQKPEEIRIGGYYLYKERHGMVALVKVVNKTFKDGWVNFTLLVKRVLFTPWEVRRGTVFEVGLDINYTNYPGSWHFEAGMTIIKSSTHSIPPFIESNKSCFIEKGQGSASESAF